MHDIIIKHRQPSLNIGIGIVFLEKYLPSSHIKISLDKNIRFLKYYREIPNIHLINAFAEKIPLRNDSVPTVTTQSTFQVMYNQKHFLKELYRILKPNGFFIITIEYGGTYDLDSQQFKISIDEKFNEYNKLVEYISKLGLNILETKYLNINGCWYNKIDKGFSLWIIGEKRG